MTQPNSEQGQSRRSRNRKNRSNRAGNSQPPAEPSSSALVPTAPSFNPPAEWGQVQSHPQQQFPPQGFGGNGFLPPVQGKEAPLQAGILPFTLDGGRGYSQPFPGALPMGYFTSNSIISVPYLNPSQEYGDGSTSAPTPTPAPAKHVQPMTKKGKKALCKSQSQAQPASMTKRDPITAPSAASGGIPDPTPAYLLRASFLAQTVPEPRAILVVIDLNGTLLHRPSSQKAPSNFVARPHACQFLTYCIDTFHVVIWSSARPFNVEKMCRRLLTPDQQSRVIATWGRDHLGLSPTDYNQRVQCYKRLTTLWEDPVVAASHPDGGQWNQGNTVLIDDSTEKARSEPYNAITLPEFVGDMHETPEVLPLVHDYLNTLAVQADISTYIRTHPFNTDTAVLTQGAAPSG
ncbi:HAD-like domain-containing protein [Cercophora newfieldiana]|uniref:Mitochondrial import inner membrane translocase subunit TIM50 n=1 Tax=Cercophora newfieldiana TaxID=92897 RepID=A0AA40CV79_9PEZI|nr:HAD-like domain-containing protein [Cercophora newfieldiana]